MRLFKRPRFSHNGFIIFYRQLVAWSVALAALVAIVAGPAALGATAAWSDFSPASLASRPAAQVWVRPPVFRGIRVEPTAMRELLALAPREGAEKRFDDAITVALPIPDGTVQRFLIVESPVMAPELAAQFPQIKTYVGVGLDDPAATLRCDVTPAGFHAQILSPSGSVFIDPLWRDDGVEHACYYKRDYLKSPDGWSCLAEGGTTTKTPIGGAPSLTSGATLRTYRIAVAATGEYTAFHGGTVAGGQSAIVTAINRVTGVYEVELGVRFVLIANNSSLVYTNSGTDPYSNGDGSAMLGQNQSNIDALIGSANYDIGHVFSTGGGGIAGLGVVCLTGNKARGVTGQNSPTGDPFYIDYVAHEIGHQFGANHTFNSPSGSCSGNRNASTAYEPGSGSTIMAYAGICSPDNLQPNSDPYFHAVSLDEIAAFITSGSGANCDVATATGNTPPSVNAGANFTIPKGTPFTLTATGSDANGDTLTFCWEERDLGASITLATADNGASPLFRSFNPTTNRSRTFPKPSALLNNTASVGENLPTLARTMNFRVTARDNRPGGGGLQTDDMQVVVDFNSGPFLVTSPNTAVTWSGPRTVTWNVAGTAGSPVNATNVDILLSTDGGGTFPTVLASALPNTGSALVILPNVVTTAARIKVQATGNIFFDISNTNFSITNSAPVPLVSGNGATFVGESFSPFNGAADPGEAVTVGFALRNLGSGPTTNLVATLRAAGGVISPTGPLTYGVLAAAGATATRNFSFVASGICGGSVEAVLDLTDGPASLGSVTNLLSLGAKTAVTNTLTRTGAIAIPTSGTRGVANPYPASLVVSNVPGTITNLTVTLTGLTHTFPDDLDVLLVGPGGQKVMLMSDAGGGGNITNAVFTFSGAAAGALSDSGTLGSGTFLPTDYATGETLDSPAPGGPYGTQLSAFFGANPNGAWALYIMDDSNTDTGSLTSWSLNLITAALACVTNAPPASDLVLTGNASAPIVPLGATWTATIIASNAGPSATGFSVTNFLPPGVVLLTNFLSTGSLSSEFPQLIWSGASLPAGATGALTLVLAPAASGAFTNRTVATTAVDDLVPGNNAVTLTFLVPADFDGDGVPDAWELANALSPTNAADVWLDVDGDGWNAFQEYLAGTDPQDAQNALLIVQVLRTGDDVEIGFTSVSGKLYRVERSDSLLAPDWQPVADAIPGTGSPIVITNLGAAVLDERVYRVRLLPPP